MFVFTYHDQDARLAQQGAGEAEQLALASAEVAALLLHDVRKL